jgi:hypothetical protein
VLFSSAWRLHDEVEVLGARGCIAKPAGLRAILDAVQRYAAWPPMTPSEVVTGVAAGITQAPTGKNRI